MKKRIILIVSLLLLCILLASCAASAPLNDTNKGDFAPEISENYTDNNLSDKEAGVLDGASHIANQKLITTVSMTVESTEYDLLVKNVLDKVKTLGGYVEKSSVQGSSADLKTGTFVLRIPAENLSLLTEAVEKGAHLLSCQESSVDVSLTYADIEGRLSSLRAEKSALDAMLQKAQTVEEAILIQERLSTVRADIESLEGQLRVLSSKINYSTLNLTVYQVEKETVPEKELTVWQRLSQRFSENAENAGRYLKNLFVSIVGGIPTLLPVLVTLLLLFGPPALVALLIVSGVRRKRRRQKEQSKQS